jgi:hypothetical protein
MGEATVNSFDYAKTGPEEELPAIEHDILISGYKTVMIFYR